MKLGLSTSLSHQSPEAWAKKHSNLGCKAVVFPVDSSAEPAVIEAYVTAAREHDLQIAEVGIWRNAIALDPEERKRNVAWSVAQLRLADAIKANCAVNVAGAAGPKWDGAYAENFSTETWKATVHMIREIIDTAEPKHTYFTIEPMPWMIPTGPDEYLRLIEAVDRDRFGVHMDLINLINSADRFFGIEKFARHTFETLGPYIKSCHLKDIRLREEYTFQLQECTPGEGTFPLELYADLVNEVDPDLPMIIEHLSSDQEYLAALAYVQNRLAKTL